MAKAKIDVYKDWLKINATNRPLTWYQILRLKPFEDDVNLIRKQYRDLNAYIRKFATGDYIEESQELLNELAKAMLCLTDAERKAEYDYQLGRKESTSVAEGETGTRRTFEQILLENRVVSPEQLKKGKQFASAVGLDLEMALLQQRAASQDAIMLAYAEAEGLPFINLDDFPVDEYYVPQINPVLARQYSFVPVLCDTGKMILASPSPLSLDVTTELEAQFNMPISSAICTPAQINAAIAKYYPRDAVQVIPAPREETSPVAFTSENKKTERTARPPKKPLSKEAQARRKKLSLIVTNFTFMGAVFGQSLIPKHPAPIGKVLVIAVVAATVMLGITWLLSSREISE